MRQYGNVWYNSRMNICSIDECPNPTSSRGLCTKHYGYHYRNGTLDSVAVSASGPRKRLPRSGPNTHSLSSVDPESKTATCSVCGPVDARLSGDVWRCGNKTREVQRAHSKRIRTQGYKSQGTLRYGDGEQVPHALAVAERIRLTEEQDGKCAICGTVTPSSLHLDHCHVNGTIRGLLCASCNIGLGHFKDDPERLKAAIEYLTR